MTLKKAIETIAKHAEESGASGFISYLINKRIIGYKKVNTPHLNDSEKQFLTNNNYTYYFRDDISEWVIELTDKS